MIAFTITTCKRLDLFQQTMSHFLSHCLDKHLISRWICVDDNSSDEDRQEMKRLYPFFEFYFKTPSEKGHAQSMNILRSLVADCEFVFHMEDDWEFFRKGKFLTRCLEILNEAGNERVCQVLINRDYIEDPAEARATTPTSLPKTLTNGRRYYLHDYIPDSSQAKYTVANCAYWPHYSFRPSLLRREIWAEPFLTTPCHFEMEYAKDLQKKGWVSAFLPDIYALHIGKKTWEVAQTATPNAYALNGESQFGAPTTKSVILNLDRRPDRWEKVSRLVPFASRVSAVDGATLELNWRMEQIFNDCDHNFRRGIVGCALSHLELWISLVAGGTAGLTDADAFAVMEDDLNFVVPDLEKKLHAMASKIPNLDVLFFGVSERAVDPSLETAPQKFELKKYNTEQSLKHSLGGTFGYLVTKQGAKKLLDYVQENGMVNAIDTMMQLAMDTLNGYYCFPPMVRSQAFSPDSDIHGRMENCRRDLHDRISEVMNVYQGDATVEYCPQVRPPRPATEEQFWVEDYRISVSKPKGVFRLMVDGKYCSLFRKNI